MKNAHTSPLTEAQWKALEALADAAHNALADFNIALLCQVGEIEKTTPNDFLVNKLLGAAKAVENAKSGFLSGYFYRPQSEWLGGEKWAIREPHISGERRTVIS